MRAARALLLAGALLVAVIPASSANASCGPVIRDACAIVCTVPHPTIAKLCTII